MSEEENRGPFVLIVQIFGGLFLVALLAGLAAFFLLSRSSAVATSTAGPGLSKDFQVELVSVKKKPGTSEVLITVRFLPSAEWTVKDLVLENAVLLPITGPVKLLSGPAPGAAANAFTVTLSAAKSEITPKRRLRLTYRYKLEKNLGFTKGGGSGTVLIPLQPPVSAAPPPASAH